VAAPLGWIAAASGFVLSGDGIGPEHRLHWFSHLLGTPAALAAASGLIGVGLVERAGSVQSFRERRAVRPRPPRRRRRRHRRAGGSRPQRRRRRYLTAIGGQTLKVASTSAARTNQTRPLARGSTRRRR
jgi:hypothetical protein